MGCPVRSSFPSARLPYRRPSGAIRSHRCQRSGRRADPDRRQIRTVSCCISLYGASGLVSQCSLDVRREQRMAVTRGRFKFWVILHTHVPRVSVVSAAWQFHNFAQIFGRRTRCHDQASRFDAWQIVVVGFVAVTVTLGHDGAVDFCRQRTGLDGASLRAQTHGAAQIGILVALLDLAVGALPFVDQSDYWLWRFQIELGGVSAGQAGLVARVFDQRDLHTEADAEVRDLVFTGELGRHDLAFHTALAEAARYQNRIVLGQFGATGGFDLFRVDVLDVDLAFVVDAGVTQRFRQRLVRLDEVHVFAG